MLDRSWISFHVQEVDGLIQHLAALREVDIWASEPEMILRSNGRSGPLRSALRLEVINWLRRFNGLKRVTVHGDCPRLKPLLEREMCLPKPPKGV